MWVDLHLQLGSHMPARRRGRNSRFLQWLAVRAWSATTWSKRRDNAVVSGLPRVAHKVQGAAYGIGAVVLPSVTSHPKCQHRQQVWIGFRVRIARHIHNHLPRAR